MPPSKAQSMFVSQSEIPAITRSTRSEAIQEKVWTTDHTNIHIHHNKRRVLKKTKKKRHRVTGRIISAVVIDMARMHSRSESTSA